MPNSGQELRRIEYRKLWDKDFLNYCISTNKSKPLVITGDFNVAHQEIDIARPKANYNKTSGYTQIEIDGFSKFLDNGFVDIFRTKNPEKIYTSPPANVPPAAVPSQVYIFDFSGFFDFCLLIFL